MFLYDLQTVGYTLANCKLQCIKDVNMCIMRVMSVMSDLTVMTLKRGTISAQSTAVGHLQF